MQKMTFEKDAKKIKDGMVFKIGEEFYLKVDYYAIRLNPNDSINFEALIKARKNEIDFIYKRNGDILFKEEK